MSSRHQNLSSFNKKIKIRDRSTFNIGVVVSDWNQNITEVLYRGAFETLCKEGVLPINIIRKNVPGSFELTLGAHLMLTSKKMDAVLCLGCVITGETRHAEYISHAVANGLTQLTILHKKPVVFGLLTPDTLEQAKERSGGKFGNKGVEAAITALHMLDF